MTYTDMVTGGVIGKASLTAGARWSFDLPALCRDRFGPGYLRLNYTVATGPFTGGTIAAYAVVDDPANIGQNQYGYPPGVTINN